MSTSVNPLIGASKCDLCSYPVEIRESKTGKVYYVCGDCQSQFFARGVKSDKLMRALAVVEVKPLSEPDEEAKDDDEGWF